MVVGAGLAGLVAAAELERAGSEVVVLEARDRVGGRTLNADLGHGKVVELGGQWIGPTQDRLAALAEELGVATYPSYSEGDNLLELDGKLRRYSGTIPRVAPHVLLDLEQLRRRLHRQATKVPLEAPWRAPRAKRLDSQTLADWLRRKSFTGTARRLVALAGKTVWGAEPEDLALLHVLFYVHSAGSLDVLIDVKGGAQERRFEGGSQLLSLKLAERLGNPVRLGEPVGRIHQGDSAVTVIGDRTEVRARRAVVAVPPNLVARIEHQPALPGARRGLIERVRRGQLVKCMAIYDEPFWRVEGLSGEGVSDAGPATLTFDNSPPDGTPGVLLGFVGGAEARRLAPDERRPAVIAGFERLFGPRAGKPERWLEQSWPDEQWTGGGPNALLGPGAWTGYGAALREPAGRVHWAGAETAERWCGYLDGAVRSGERAASEVIGQD